MHRAISWTNADSVSVTSCSLHPMTTSLAILKVSFTAMCLKLILDFVMGQCSKQWICKLDGLPFIMTFIHVYKAQWPHHMNITWCCGLAAAYFKVSTIHIIDSFTDVGAPSGLSWTSRENDKMKSKLNMYRIYHKVCHTNWFKKGKK